MKPSPREQQASTDPKRNCNDGWAERYLGIPEKKPRRQHDITSVANVQADIAAMRRRLEHATEARWQAAARRDRGDT